MPCILTILQFQTHVPYLMSAHMCSGVKYIYALARDDDNFRALYSVFCSQFNYIRSTLRKKYFGITHFKGKANGIYTHWHTRQEKEAKSDNFKFNLHHCYTLNPRGAYTKNTCSIKQIQFINWMKFIFLPASSSIYIDGDRLDYR